MTSRGRELTGDERQFIEDRLDHAADLLAAGRHREAVAACVENRDWLGRTGAAGQRFDAYLGHTHQVHAVCCAEAGALDEAVAHYGKAEEALSRHPGNHEQLVQCMHNAALLLVQNGAHAVAIGVLRRAKHYARDVPGPYFGDIAGFLEGLTALDDSVPGQTSADIDEAIADLRARVAGSTDPAARAADLGNLAGLMLEHGSAEHFDNAQHLLLHCLAYYRTNRHWDSYVSALGILRVVLQRPIVLNDPVIREVALAVQESPRLPSLSWQADVCETAAAVTLTQASVAPLRDRTVPLALRAIAYKDAGAARMRSTLVRGLQGASSGEIARRIALTAAADARDPGLFVELLESGRLQVVPVARAAGGPDAAPNPTAEVASAGAVELSRIYPLSTDAGSRLRPYFPPDATMPADLSLFEAIALIGGPAAWWWGGTVIDGRYFWAVVTPTLTMSVGYRDLEADELQLLMTAAEAVQGDVAIEELLVRPLCSSPEAEEEMSLALGELLVPDVLREAWWDHAVPEWTPSLVIASNFLGGLATCLFGLRDRSGRVERLIEKATLRWAPTAPIVQAVAAHPAYYADHYPVGIACINPDGSLPFAALARGRFEIILGRTGRSDGSAPATRAAFCQAFGGIAPADPKIFFYTGHSDGGVAGLDAALLLEDGRLTAEDLLFGLGDGRPVAMPSRVLFSSCSSSGSVGAGRGEWLGLMAACLLRGAGHVIGTAWRILDHPSTLRLEEELLADLAGGADPATALRACQLRRLASWRAGGHDFRAGTRLAVPDHLELPLIWASFQWSGAA